MFRRYFDLFYTFLKIGAFTFGGGWAMIAMMEREIVDNHKWIDRDEFLDLVSLAQSLPGLLAVNISVAIGQKILGNKGSFVAAIATIIPSFTIILMIAIFLTPDTIKNNETLTRIFKGIRPAVVALIAVPVFQNAKRARITWKTLWIPISVALLIYSKIPYLSNPILYIILAGIFGIILYKQKQLKEEVK